jgi:trans-aconitate 2-methyltransferase
MKAQAGAGVTADDWDPGSYARWRDLRLRPALDLLLQVGMVPGGDVIDLGCGDGAAVGALRQRFPKARVAGVDTSVTMLAKARGYHATQVCDIAAWLPERPPALIFSNAALQWLGDHDRLLPRLAGLLMPGGVLAVQMPRQYGAPSHALLRDLARALFPGRFDAPFVPPVAAPAVYHRLLAKLGKVNVWETGYLQLLDAVAMGHPVRSFTESTAMRPFLQALTAAEAVAFVAAYDDALARAYPAEDDGRVLFPFRRLFLTIQTPR